METRSRKYGCSSIRRESTPTRAVSPWLPRERRDRCGNPCAAIELADGTIITSETSELLGPSAALILNATKHLAGIDHSVKLIPQEMIEPIQKTKTEYLGGHNPRLHTDEVLVALSVLSQADERCRRALEKLPEFRGCQVHSTVMLSEVDRKIFPQTRRRPHLRTGPQETQVLTQKTIDPKKQPYTPIRGVYGCFCTPSDLTSFYPQYKCI